MIPTTNVVLNGWGKGKTYEIMSEIHDLIIAGRGSEILVVFPTLDYLHWWTRAWQDRFPQIPMVDYVSVTNTLKLRGRFYTKIYVEDIDLYDEGIYDERLIGITVSLRSHSNDEELVLTCSPTVLSLRSHSRITTSKDVMKRLKK